MIAVTVGNRTDDIHVAFHGMAGTLCGIPGGSGLVAMLEYSATCEKCIKACRELITTLQACIAGSDKSEPQTGCECHLSINYDRVCSWCKNQAALRQPRS